MVSYYTIIIAHVNTINSICDIHTCTLVNKYIYWIDTKSIARDKSEHALNMAHFCTELHVIKLQAQFNENSGIMHAGTSTSHRARNNS